MSDSTELLVTFRTNNPQPLQELKGIFSGCSYGIPISIVPLGTAFEVHIYELALLEILPLLKRVVRHCNRNNRIITFTVTQGEIYPTHLKNFKE